MTPAQARSGLYVAHQAWLHRAVPRSSDPDKSDSLADYSKKCEIATGIKIPKFNCGEGTDVGNQGDVPDGTACNKPNVLNGSCDPGSKFQVLPGRSTDAVAVAHCRKVGLPVDGDVYNDIAIIQYNKKTGAVCFYQALTNLPGSDIPSPAAPASPDGSGNDGSRWSDNATHWLSPETTHSIGCTGCHDNGGFIRSEYIAQVAGKNALPTSGSGFDNKTTPLAYVGKDFVNDRSWSVNVSKDTTDHGKNCETCHRLGISNVTDVFGLHHNGTAAHFSLEATAATQPSKNPHSFESPIWMRPGQILYNAATEKTAQKYSDCAIAFAESNFTSAPAGCVAKPLGKQWVQPTGSQFTYPDSPPLGPLVWYDCNGTQKQYRAGTAPKGCHLNRLPKTGTLHQEP